MTAELSDADFEKEVLESEIPVVVDFWAEWCGPCRVFAPTFSEVEKSFAGKARFFKVNIDLNPDAPSKYGVRSIPTILIFKEGKVASSKIGSMTKGSLKEWVTANL